MSVLGFLTAFAGMCCALQWQWFASRMVAARAAAGR